MDCGPDFPLGAWFCSIWGHPGLVCRLQNIIVGWENHGIHMPLCFPQPDWSKWSFTEYTHLLLGALKMILPLHFTASVYLTSECEFASLHSYCVYIHSFHGIILSFWKGIEYLNHCDVWTDSLAGFLCCFLHPVPWSITLVHHLILLKLNSFSSWMPRACSWLFFLLSFSFTQN